MSNKTRRTFSAQFKFEAVMDMLHGEKSIAAICRERQIKDTLLYKWRDAFMERAPSVFEDKRSVKTSDETTSQIAELERLVGRLTLENEILKKARNWLSESRKNSGG
jgi:transposase-like protein